MSGNMNEARMSFPSWHLPFPPRSFPLQKATMGWEVRQVTPAVEGPWALAGEGQGDEEKPSTHPRSLLARHCSFSFLWLCYPFPRGEWETVEGLGTSSQVKGWVGV